MKILLTLFTLAMVSLSSPAAEGPIRHIVSFKFKKDADPEKVRAVEESFAALKQKIALIQSLEWGTNNSPEGHNKGFTHCWVVTFKNAADRDAYLIHPDHKEFASKLGGVLDDAFVIDFIPKE